MAARFPLDDRALVEDNAVKFVYHLEGPPPGPNENVFVLGFDGRKKYKCWMCSLENLTEWHMGHQLQTRPFEGVCWDCKHSWQASDGDILEQPDVKAQIAPGVLFLPSRRLRSAMQNWARYTFGRRGQTPNVPPPAVQNRLRELQKRERR